MNPVIIGREEEIKILERLLHSKTPELLAIYGRRRVGKTFLIRSYFREHLIFGCTGQYNGKTREQLINFTQQLNLHFPGKTTVLAPSTWQEAFQILREKLSLLDEKTKKVLFFDELPWLDTHKSGFLSAFGYFWNTYAERRNDLLVVICGSAASWIIEKVVNNKGGLHNRITQRIRLLPFTLGETQAYFQQKNILLDQYQLLQLYMVMGGVPAYLTAVEKGKSVEQIINNCCFSKDGVLVNEFNNLYTSLFNNPQKHINVIRALARKNKGLTRNEILATGKIITGGAISTVLTELEESGFIERTFPFGKKEKDALFRLADEFSLFYLKFMEKQGVANHDGNDWTAMQRTQSYVSWCGYAFENICLKHIRKIKQALQIGAVHTDIASWFHPGRENHPGAQIDLLIDRADHCINLCEMKFSNDVFVIDKRYAGELENKTRVFKTRTRTKKTIFPTIITPYGVRKNDYYTNLIQAEVVATDLFR